MKHIKEFNEFVNEGIFTTIIGGIIGFFALTYAVKKVFGKIVEYNLKFPKEKLKAMVDAGVLKGFEDYIKSDQFNGDKSEARKKISVIKKYLYSKIDNGDINTINDFKKEFKRIESKGSLK